MLLGSLQAGLAFSNASLGAVHALAHSMGGFLDLPHGECNALLLEHVVRFNMTAAPARYRQIGEAMGIDTRGMNDAEAADAAASAVEALMKKVGAPTTLAAAGLERDVVTARIADIIGGTMSDLNCGSNPRPVNDPNAVTAFVMAAI